METIASGFLDGRLPTLALTIAQIAVAVGLFACRLERRERLAARLAAVIAIPIVATLLFWTGYITVIAAVSLSETGLFWVSIFAQMFFFALIIGYFTWAVCFLFEARVWTALFCCTAGYAVQNFASGLLELLWTARFGTGIELTAEMDVGRMLPNALCSLVVYALFYLLVVRHASRRGLEEIHEPLLIGIMVVVMFGIIGFDVVIKQLTREVGVAFSIALALRCVHGIMCALTYALEYELLVSRHLAMEAAATERVLAERERQYEQSRANIEAINVKCHDLRHQIRHLGEAGGAGAAAVDPAALADIAREVDVYDSTVRTGNDALDTILTEKRLLCTREGVSLSVVADGGALAMMSAADIYSFFGNALDNAIEAAEKIDDAAARSISVVVRQAAGVASIHVENRFAASNAPQVRADGLLATSKSDTTAHGFGVRSMRLTVERYGGTLATLAQGDTFHVNAILPLQ